ncbi:MAG: hypothetical protein OHK0013_08310 [Sandaracinaceae bacterium]
MVQMWIEGGWGMFPVLIFGLVTLYASGRYAVDGEPARLRFVAAMSVVLVAAMGHAMLTNVAAVFSFLQDPERAPDGELTRILFTGLMESTRPGALGGALLVLALVLVAVGVYRAGRRELRLAAA